MKLNIILKSFFILLLYSCTDIPELTDVNIEKWKNDKLGCNGNRIEMIASIIDQKNKLKGLSQNEVIKLLGTADQHELYERSQKFFIYHLEPSKKCDNYAAGYYKAFYIRFNSLDQAVDFNIQEVK